jgi:hypothetical protein
MKILRSRQSVKTVKCNIDVELLGDPSANGQLSSSGARERFSRLEKIQLVGVDTFS